MEQVGWGEDVGEGKGNRQSAVRPPLPFFFTHNRTYIYIYIYGHMYMTAYIYYMVLYIHTHKYICNLLEIV